MALYRMGLGHYGKCTFGDDDNREFKGYWNYVKEERYWWFQLDEKLDPSDYSDKPLPIEEEDLIITLGKISAWRSLESDEYVSVGSTETDSEDGYDSDYECDSDSDYERYSSLDEEEDVYHPSEGESEDYTGSEYSYVESEEE